MEPNKQKLIACAALAAMIWSSGAFAKDPIERVMTLLAQERYAEARKVLDPLLASETNQLRVRVMHGILREREGKPEEAIRVFERLLSDHPRMFEPYNNLAVLYTRQGRLEDARRAFIAALERRPEAVVYANLGDLYMRLADRAYKQARELSARAGASSERSEKYDRIPLRLPTQAQRPQSPTMKNQALAKAGAPAPSPQGSATRDEPPAAAATQAQAAVAAATQNQPQVPAERPQETEVASESETASDTASAEICVEAGRFKNRALTGKAADWIRARGAEIVEIRSEEHRVVKSHWVYLPAAANQKAAAATERALRSRGVRDVAIIGKGARANAISLGVYRKKNNATRRISQLRKLGYSALSAENRNTDRQYVIKMRTYDDRSVFRGTLTAKFPGLSIRDVDCPVRE